MSPSDSIDSSAGEGVGEESRRPLRVLGLDARLVFGILLCILVAPSVFFIEASYRQLGQILESIHAPPGTAARELLERLPAPRSASAGAFQDRARVALERDAMTNRQQRASALLATRTWIYFMSLIFGAILVVIGAAFVLGRITAPMSEGSVKWGDLGGSISSSSPGLFLVAFGCLLIALPILRLGRIEVLDASSFFTTGSLAARPPPAEQREAALADILEKAKARMETSE